MKPGDLIKIKAKRRASANRALDAIAGQFGVLIEEYDIGRSNPRAGRKQWKVFVDGEAYWLYPGDFEVQE
tara:strand:+ start:126 stop:335 length:210 start_codon:yes stop_codon:yes gene_type:complete